jgi:hypothetical protein
VKVDTLTYSQIQKLVLQLPETKLPFVYKLLSILVDNENDAEILSPQLEFILLPLAERQRLLAQQAEQMAAHYAQTASEREEWQGGDFIDAD